MIVTTLLVITVVVMQSLLSKKWPSCVNDLDYFVFIRSLSIGAAIVASLNVAYPVAYHYFFRSQHGNSASVSIGEVVHVFLAVVLLFLVTASTTLVLFGKKAMQLHWGIPVARSDAQPEPLQCFPDLDDAARLKQFDHEYGNFAEFAYVSIIATALAIAMGHLIGAAKR